MDSQYIYKGPWINWSKGAVVGATLTLSDRDGGLLISFVATFVTIVAAQLWRILSFTSHQVRSTSEAQDGLHFQQQNVFRNATTPGSAAWIFLQQAWHWRGRSRAVFWRTVPLATFAVFYIVLFGVLATFSSQVSESAGSLRLIHGGNCGYWRINEDLSARSREGMSAYQRRMSLEAATSSNYARACYADTPAKLQCGSYPTSQLAYTTTTNASCPFASGICVYGDTAALKVETQRLNSHFDLGINTPTRHRLDLIKETTCAPLVQKRAPFNGTTEATGPGTEGDVFLRYYYGNVADFNYTYQYNTQSMYVQMGYGIHTLGSVAPHSPAGWMPSDELIRDDADLSIVFIAANSMEFQTQVDDPVFGAHYAMTKGDPDDTFYEVDEYNVAIACAERYAACEPGTERCTDKTGVRQLFATAVEQLDLNNAQLAVITRTQLALQLSTVYSQTDMRLVASLRAADTAAGRVQPSLPANQWEIEVKGWFETGLARLQFLLQDYATGPSQVPEYSYVYSPDDIYSKAMCYSQLIRDTQDTKSFSILGLVIIFVIGGVLILTSMILDTVVGWVQTLTKRGLGKKEAWLQDDKLQLQRNVLGGHWDVVRGFPVSARDDRFVRAEFSNASKSVSSSIGHQGYASVEQREAGETMPSLDGQKGVHASVREAV